MGWKGKPLTVVKGVEPSTEVRRKLAAEGGPVIVAFSGGKDSLATYFALRDIGIETYLVALYAVPGLKFQEDYWDYLECELGQTIYRYPSPAMFRFLRHGLFQSQARVEMLQQTDLASVDYDVVWRLVREDLGLPADTWVADGVRANDAPHRRMSIGRWGPMKEHSRKVSPVYDWGIVKVREVIAENGIKPAPDYEWFGRTFDGLDAKFVAPLREHAPDDFARLLQWFPLLEVELVRHGL